MFLLNAVEELKSAIARHPVTLPLDAKVLDAIDRMSGCSENLENGGTANNNSLPDTTGSSYVVIVDGRQVVGLLTERNVVCLVGQRLTLERLTLRDIVKDSPVTIRESALTDLATAIALFQQHQLSHLPILDDADRLVGIVTRESLQQVFGSIFRQQVATREPEFLLESQYDVLERIAKAEPLPDILNALVQTTELHLPDTLCSILLCEDGHLYCAAAPSLPPDYCDAIDGAPIAEGVGSCGTAAFRGEEIVVCDIAANPLWQDDRDLALAHNLQACWSVPIVGSEGIVLGVFGIYYRERRSPHPRDLKQLRQLGNIAGIAIEQFQTTQALTQLNRELERRVEEHAAALQDSDRRYASLAAAAPVVIYRLDKPLHISYINERWSEMTGRPPEAALGYGWMNALHPDDREEFIAHWSESYSLDDLPHEFFLHDSEGRHLRPDGTVNWFYSRLARELDERGNVVGYIGTLTDISDRKAAELALQDAQAQFRRMTENVPGMIYRWVLRADGTQAFLYISSKVREFFELEPEAVLNNEALVWERIHSDDIPRLQNDIKINTEVLQSFKSEFRLLLPQKGLRWVQINSQPEQLENGDVLWDGMMIDISDRKSAEQELLLKQNHLKALLNNIPHIAWIKDEQSRFIAVNQPFADICGVSAEALVGQTDYDIWPAELARAYRDDDFQVLQSDRRKVVEERISLGNGTLGWLETTKTPFRDVNGNLAGTVGIAADITERKQAEQQLQELSERLELALQSAQIGIWEYDFKNDRLSWDNRMFAIYGVRPEDFSGTHHDWEKRVHPDDLDRSLPDGAAGKHRPIKEFRILRPNGEVRHIFSSAFIKRNEQEQPIRTVGVNLDISDRKQTELTLEQEVLRRTTIFNTSSDGIHIIDIKGNLIEANASFLRMLRYTEEEATHLNVADWDARWTREELQEMIQNYPWGMSELWTLETLHRRKDKSVFPVEISICGMEWNGQFSLVCIGRDISERKQAEVQLQHTNEELIRATRLKDEFLANMSHELRTPLNAILGMSESLQEGLLGAINPKQRKALKTIERSGAHLLELINEILDLAKIESGRVELEYSTVAVTDLCQLSLAFIKQQAFGKRVQLHLELPINLPNIRVDERRIRQVLINLLSNAVKFTPAEGRIALEVLPLPSDKTHNQSYLRFSVTDTGIGIAPENLKKLFQPFVQVDSALNRQYEGTGLGLALVKRIVELHGGEIAVTSEVGVGSRFSIELPYITVESHLPTAEPALALNLAISESEQLSTGPLILLAEDNDANINTLSSYLEAKGYRLQVAKNGRAAINLARTNPPNIILMDVQMPGMDGLEAIEHLRELPELTQIPIIALTALAMQDDRERCLAAGATMYLSKPVRLKHLARSIENLLE
ncbi:MAG: PAS domain S-box protein [Cyanobacteria bacterium SBLK]|nr:PAS domain S-box protein [Cyanobacteria bacterium SBLK]